MHPTAKQIVTKLQQAGFITYFAGGAVRDQLLDRPSADIDIATSATPEQVTELFPRTKPLATQYGVTLVIAGGHAFEVTTFRGETEYDGRRPAKVYFTDPEQDAKRRDFTVNGLFWDPIEKQIFDFVSGQHDLKLKIIRFIGDPAERIIEDHLRILRAIRFRNVLQFEYEPATAAAVKKHAKLIKNISAERVRDELNNMLANENRAAAIRDLDAFGLLKIILPELTKLKGLAQPAKYHREGDAFTHSLGSLAALPTESRLAVCWAVLLHDIGKAETAACKMDSGQLTFPCHAKKSAQLARGILKRLKFDRVPADKICWLVQQHMTLGSVPNMRGAHRHRLFIHPWFVELLAVCRADIGGTDPADYSLVNKIEKMYRDDHDAKLLAAPKELLSSAEIMSALDISPGPELGRLKQLLYDAQIEKEVSDRQSAVQFLESQLKR